VKKWRIPKHVQNLPSVLEEKKSSYQQEILVTTLTALPAVKQGKGDAASLQKRAKWVRERLCKEYGAKTARPCGSTCAPWLNCGARQKGQKHKACEDDTKKLLKLKKSRRAVSSMHTSWKSSYNQSGGNALSGSPTVCNFPSL
jgi:hypothetical protein